MASRDFYIRKYGKREGTKAYNAYHRKYKRTHRMKINAARKVARSGVRLTEAQIIRIMEMAEEGLTIPQIAQRLDLSKPVVRLFSEKS